jgi:FlaA1/EpsC-like NDP-sugar epimerase
VNLSALTRLGNEFWRRVFEIVRDMSRTRKRLIFLLFDLIVMNIALVVALAVSPHPLPPSGSLVFLFASLTLLGAGISWALGLPKIKLNAYDWSAILRTAVLAVSMTVLGHSASLAQGIPASIFSVYAPTLFTLSVLGRISLLHLVLWLYRREVEQRRVLIYGAGATGMQLAAALSTHDAIDPVAFVDDNPALAGLTVSGLPVHAPTDLKRLIERKRVDRVLVAIPQMPRYKMTLLVAKLQTLGVDVHAVPSFAELVGEAELLRRIEPVSVEGLLGRAQVNNDLPGTEQTFTGRTVMVTGAGGSIGSELCRQLLGCGLARLVLFDVSEASLYQIDRELRDLAGPEGPEIVARLGTVTDARAVRRVIAQYDVTTILHAAAYKHVPLVESNPLVGLDNNVIGTRVVAEAARDMKLTHFVLVSSDKAVRPKNVMGASKRMAELIVQDLATRSTTTRFSMVRFGNVLGSSGSVFPLFQDQIAKGGPVTVTHDEVTRYFMTIPEAARLVLTATTFARGGDVFVLDMGAPVSIRKMARQMIVAAGYTVRDERHPDGDIEIRIIGLRPGEKLHEELLIGADRVTTPHPKILRAQEDYLSEIEVANMLRDLQASLDSSDDAAAHRVVRRWIADNALEAPEGTVVFTAQTGA